MQLLWYPLPISESVPISAGLAHEGDLVFVVSPTVTQWFLDEFHNDPSHYPFDFSKNYRPYYNDTVGV